MASIKMRILVISDTHGDDLIHKPITGTYDVAIHCGDLTEESKLDEFRASLNMMLSVQASLKLIVAGNRDFSLDTPILENKLADNTTAEDADLVKRTYGDFGEARALFESDAAKAAGIRFLDEGNYIFDLANGASLSVYASPYTASKACTWGFQYRPSDDHQWDIKPNTDIAITHSPPHGVLNYTGSKTIAGSPSLFAAIAGQSLRCTALVTSTRRGELRLSDGVRLTRTTRKATLEALPRPTSLQSTTIAQAQLKASGACG